MAIKDGAFQPLHTITPSVSRPPRAASVPRSSDALPSVFIPRPSSLLPLLTHFLRRRLSRLHTAPSGPAITLPIKPHVIAELQAMSSILRPGVALAIAGPIVLMVLCHIK